MWGLKCARLEEANHADVMVRFMYMFMKGEIHPLFGSFNRVNAIRRNRDMFTFRYSRLAMAASSFLS